MKNSRFAYVKYDTERMFEQAQIRKAAEEMEALIEQHVPAGEHRDRALEALEVSYMWTGKGLRDKQIALNGSAPEQPERGDS